MMILNMKEIDQVSGGIVNGINGYYENVKWDYSAHSASANKWYDAGRTAYENAKDRTYPGRQG